MWHEARRHERKLRGIMVDYRKRAERRKEFYERTRAEPGLFLRLTGQSVKVNTDPAISLAAESPQSMMPWNGDTSTMIDRFDVRAHLDIIPLPDKGVKTEEDDEDRMLNYERYRVLIQNDALGTSEKQCLHQIHLDEQFGDVSKPTGSSEEEKKNPTSTRLAKTKAAIGFTYDDSTDTAAVVASTKPPHIPAPKKSAVVRDAPPIEKADPDDHIDLDMLMDFSSLDAEQRDILNESACEYGMRRGDFTMMMKIDEDEEEERKAHRALVEEKLQYSGKEFRRERRIFKDKRNREKEWSPPSYAKKADNEHAEQTLLRRRYKRMLESRGSSSDSNDSSSDSSRSSSPQVEFITSFGGSDDEGSGVKPSQTVAPKPKKKKSHRVTEKEKRKLVKKVLSAHNRPPSPPVMHGPQLPEVAYVNPNYGYGPGNDVCNPFTPGTHQAYPFSYVPPDNSQLKHQLEMQAEVAADPKQPFGFDPMALAGCKSGAPQQPSVNYAAIFGTATSSAAAVTPGSLSTATGTIVAPLGVIPSLPSDGGPVVQLEAAAGQAPYIDQETKERILEKLRKGKGGRRKSGSISYAELEEFDEQLLESANGKSRSPSPKRQETKSPAVVTEPSRYRQRTPPPPVKRYRRAELDSEEEDDEWADDKRKSGRSSGSSGTTSLARRGPQKPSTTASILPTLAKHTSTPGALNTKVKLTPQQKLKLRMQAALGKQPTPRSRAPKRTFRTQSVRADRAAELERQARAIEEKHQREEELIAQQNKLRRLAQSRKGDGDDSDDSRSPSPEPIASDATSSLPPPSTVVAPPLQQLPAAYQLMPRRHRSPTPELLTPADLSLRKDIFR